MAVKSDQTGGYNVEFVTTLDTRYKCPACTFALRSPFQTSCGHRFCKSCIKPIIESGPKICPVDNSPLTLDHIFRDAFCNREILDLECYCNCKPLGCEWTGQLRNMEKHQDEECPKIKLPCPNQCGLTVPREDMERHIGQDCVNAESTCPYEFGACAYQSSRGNLKKHLQEKSVDHAYKIQDQVSTFKSLIEDLQTKQASMTLQIQQLERQLSDENEFLMPLRDDIEGLRGLSKNQEKKIQDIVVATQALSPVEKKENKGAAKPDASNEFNDVKTKLKVVEDQIAKLQTRERQALQTDCNNKSRGCRWTGPVAEEKVHRDCKCQFVEVNCLYGGCNVKIERRLLRTHMTQACRFKKETCHCQCWRCPANEEPHWQGTPNYRYPKLLPEEQNTTATPQVPIAICSTGEETMALERRVTRMEHQHTLSDVQMAEHDVKITVLEMTSYDGTFIWKIEDLGRRIHEAVTGKALSIYSTPFFVGRFGYKVCARVYLNGDGMGKGTHLSLFFVVMRGANDALLPWPFQQKVSFKLIDQTGDQHIVDSFRPDPNSSSFQRPTGNMNIASGCPLFVPKSVLHSRGYIKDEALFFKITVESTGIPSF